MEKIGKYRWTICGLLFFATTINYIDRSVISFLKSTFTDQLGWTDGDYANVEITFKIFYAIGMMGAGRIIDKLGTKIGYGLFTFLWSVAGICTSLVNSVIGFQIVRGFLGVTESGNFPAAIKTVAEWFPKKERALATGIFNSGANVGAILAPLTVPWIADNWGWEAAFLIIGGIGFLWLIFWFLLYEIPTRSKRVGATEFAYIHADKDEESAATDTKNEKVAWLNLIKYKQTWAFSFGKFMTDGVWWFFLFWLPAYLKAQYGMTGMAVTFPLAVLYTMSTVGSIGGGWFPMYYIRKGYEPYAARMKAMLTIAL